MHDSEESKFTRFVSGLRREIKDVVELYEYSSLKKLVHLAIKVESQISKKTTLKNTPNDGFYKSYRKDANNISTKTSTSHFFKRNHFSPKKFLNTILLPLPLSHPPKFQAQNVLNV